MPYIIKRKKTYYYSRRVPKALCKFDPREKVIISLHTDSPSKAEEQSIAVNKQVESYWQKLIEFGNVHSDDAFLSVLNTARLIGFSYKSSQELAKDSIVELVNRVQVAQKLTDQPELVKASLGGATTASIQISAMLEKFWEISKAALIGKSSAQIRKWENPRKKAVRNFIMACGDKPLGELNRDDMIVYKDSLTERIATEQIIAGSANKEIVHLKGVIGAIDLHLKLSLDMKWLFDGLSFNETKKSDRPSFETDFVQHHLLNIDNHTLLNHDALLILYAMADTGARPSELVGLREEDIILDGAVPHIKIRAYKGKALKTPESERDIPLVGGALWAFKQAPQGFPRYREKKAGADTLSATINKHLKAKELLPSKKHTLYSLRHSFKNRINELAIPEQVQAQLMGHAYKGIRYGEGASLEKRHEWLKHMCFEAPRN